jgi:hypothetical protein
MELKLVVQCDIGILLTGQRQRHRADNHAGPLRHPDGGPLRAGGHVLDLLHIRMVRGLEVAGRQIGVPGDAGDGRKVGGDGGTDGDLRLHPSMVVPAIRCAVRNSCFRD